MSEARQLFLENIKLEFELLGVEGFEPKTFASDKWLEWITNISRNTCASCMNLNGNIIDIFDSEFEHPPLHINCRCESEIMLAILAGTATIDGDLGADLWMIAFNELPWNYITKREAQKSGWVDVLGNLNTVLPGKTIGGIVFKNNKDLLPIKIGKTWKEADLNYSGGYRNGHRLLYSNDGLIFVTYDHYKTFYEIVMMEG